MLIHSTCGNAVTLNRAYISEGDPDSDHQPYYFAVCLSCDEDLFESEVSSS